MSFVVVAKFPCTPRQPSPFRGCERIDVVFTEAANTYLLVEYCDLETSYDRYLQWRTNTGIADALAPITEGGWEGILASVDRLEYL